MSHCDCNFNRHGHHELLSLLPDSHVSISRVPHLEGVKMGFMSKMTNNYKEIRTNMEQNNNCVMRR